MIVKSKQELLESIIEKKELPRIFKAFTDAVKTSFDTDKGRVQSQILTLASNPTQAEIRDRTNMCYDLFMVMRGDMKYSITRTLDMLPKALRVKLDTGHWEPPPTECGSWGLPKV
jgi:hypothetical protein